MCSYLLSFYLLSYEQDPSHIALMLFDAVGGLDGSGAMLDASLSPSLQECSHIWSACVP
jgi:hypothetical protein